MEEIDIEIPELINTDDLTIIYKGKKDNSIGNEEELVEIKTLKEEFLRKLRFFKDKAIEINQTNEILIHDIYPIKIFKEFINTLKTKKVRVNEINYSYFHDLSAKYEYYELKQQIEIFCEKRPDINNLINDFKFDKIDYIKEERIAKNLDICLQNEMMVNFPIQILIRIINSPKRKINNHSLLFSFVKKVIKNYEETKADEDEEIKNQNIQLLLASLNYLQMSNDELDELFNDKHFSNLFNNQGTKEIMKNFADDRKNTEKKIKKFEELVDSQEQKHSNEINLIQKEMFEKINELNLKFEEQNKILHEYEKVNESLKQEIQTQENRMNEYEANYLELNQKFEEQNKILHKYLKDNESLKQKIQTQEKKMNEHEAKIKELDIHEIKGLIEINLNENLKIEGKIMIKEKGVRLDSSKSKYILNTDNSLTLKINDYNTGYLFESLTQNFSFIKPAGTYYLHALLVDNLGNSKQIVSSPVKINKKVSMTFDYTGKVQSVTLDPGKYKLEVWGAEGGNNGEFYGKSGKGGYSTGVLTLTKKTPLFIYVGESPSSVSGGWNGGGSGTNSIKSNKSSAGGGGATDISLLGIEGSSEWNTTDHLLSRIIVAGAGGGSGKNSYSSGMAGCGGGVVGEDGQYDSKHGTKNISGTGFGIGGNYNGRCSSGGGGGWYGGGVSRSDITDTGGSGGSGYVYNSSTSSNYPNGCKLNSAFYLENSSTINGKSSFPSPSDNSNEVGHSGNGYAKITPL